MEIPKPAEGQRLKAAIVGAGLMGRWHAYYANRCGAAVAAVVDRDRTAAGRLSASCPGSHPFDDLDAMLRQVRPAVVHVCTPSSTHQGIAESVLQAGAHLLIEKPLAPSAAETEMLLERAARQGLHICPVHQFPFQDGVRHVAAHLPLIGPPLHLQAMICSAGGDGAADAGLDSIASEILPHPLSLLGVLWPAGLQHRGWSATRPRPGEIRAFLEHEGASCSIVISMSGRPTECSFRITAAGGTAYMDLFHGFAAIEQAGVTRIRKILHPFEASGRQFLSAAFNLAGRALRREPAYPGLRRLIQLFYSAVLLNRPAPIDRQQILGVARAREDIVFATGVRTPQEIVP